MPVWVQNLGISLYGYLWSRERLGGAFPLYVEGFTSRESWGAERFEVHLRDQLRKVLAHSLAEVPYYAKVWRELGVEASDLGHFQLADLARLPPTPKQALRHTPGEFIARDVALRRRLRRYYSSGTTGTPVTVFCTVDGHRQFRAAREARSFRWAGVSMLSPRAMIGGRLVVPKAMARPPFHRYNRAEQQVYFSAYHLSPATAPEYVAALNHHQPRVFTGYAWSYFLLARMMLEQGLNLNYQPAALVLSSERLTEPMKTVMYEAFHARAYEEYGCVEDCVLATECEAGRLHVSPDFGIVEIVDDQNRALPPGVEGRILCTSLLNEAQPLVRYDIGDIGAWSNEICPCGRALLPVLKEIVGRLEDVVTGPDGRQMVRFHGIFIDLPHVLEGQVVQETSRRFSVRVVIRPGFGEAEARQIRDRMSRRLGDVDVNVEPVPAIPRTDKGKFRAVISKLDSAEHSQNERRRLGPR
jgi:phenylacetate-CoA ligase